MELGRRDFLKGCAGLAALAAWVCKGGEVLPGQNAAPAVPSGKVRFYDAAKGFGFIAKDDGGDVYVRADALPPSVAALKPGEPATFEVQRANQVVELSVTPGLRPAARRPVQR